MSAASLPSLSFAPTHSPSGAKASNAASLSGSSHSLQAIPAHVIESAGVVYQCRLRDAAIVFYDARNATSSKLWKRVLNAFSQCIAKGYNHCEIAFRVDVTPPMPADSPTGLAGAEQYIGCTMEGGQTLAIDFRCYESANWRFYGLSLSRPQLEHLFAVCMRDVERGVPFNMQGYLWNFVSPRAWQLDYGGRQVFCSEHVLRTLREIGVSSFDELVPYATHPHHLFLYLFRSGAINNIVPRPGALLRPLQPV